MIKGIVFDTVCELKITGNADFWEDLAVIKDGIKPMDRTYNEDRKTFLIKNYTKYANLPFIKSAFPPGVSCPGAVYQRLALKLSPYSPGMVPLPFGSQP